MKFMKELREIQELFLLNQSILQERYEKVEISRKEYLEGLISLSQENSLEFVDLGEEFKNEIE